MRLYIIVIIRCSNVGVIRVYRVVMAELSTIYHHNQIGVKDWSGLVATSL